MQSMQSLSYDQLQSLLEKFQQLEEKTLYAAVDQLRSE